MTVKRVTYMNIAKYIRDVNISTNARIAVGRAIARALTEDNPMFDRVSFMYVITGGKASE